MLPENPNHAWDREIPWSATYSKLIDDFKSNKYGGRHQIKMCILLIALRNGSRRHEAVEAYHKFIKDEDIINEKDEKKRIVVVRVEKQKKKVDKRTGRIKKPRKRRMIIPIIIPSDLGRYKQTEQNLREFSAYHYLWNPHSLRYALVGKLSDTETPQTIAKITGHASLEMILDYSSDKRAKRVLTELKPD